MITPREFLDCYLLGRHRLDAIPLLPLGCSFETATALYGHPVETTKGEQTPEITSHTFTAGRYHKVVAEEWQGTLQLLTYWSHKPDPARDLARYMEFHGDGITWKIMEAGFWYQRSDGERRIWTSIAPAIGVASVEFLLTRAGFKRAWEIRQLDSLKDPTWAANGAIHDMQKRFVAKEDTVLLDFVRRSNRMATSPDGRNLVIVRDHHARDDRDGFQEMNSPPDLTDGYSTQVLNFFDLEENTGAMWGKATLPRDAVVDDLRHDEAGWHLTIRQTTTDRSLTFTGSIRDLRALHETSFLSPMKDGEMWAILEKIHRKMRGHSP